MKIGKLKYVFYPTGFDRINGTDNEKLKNYTFYDGDIIVIHKKDDPKKILMYILERHRSIFCQNQSKHIDTRTDTLDIVGETMDPEILSFKDHIISEDDGYASGIILCKPISVCIYNDLMRHDGTTLNELVDCMMKNTIEDAYSYCDMYNTTDGRPITVEFDTRTDVIRHPSEDEKFIFKKLLNYYDVYYSETTHEFRIGFTQDNRRICTQKMVDDETYYTYYYLDGEYSVCSDIDMGREIDRERFSKFNYFSNPTKAYNFRTHIMKYFADFQHM